LGRFSPWAPRIGAVSAGLAAGFAHPPFGFLPGLLGYAGVLWLVDRADPARPLRSAFWRGWLAGLAYFVVGAWWVAEAFFVDAVEQGWMAPIAVAGLAAGMALYWGGACALYRWIAPRGAARLLVFAAVFAGFEWLRGHLLTGFPWDLPGESWRAGGAVSQGASLVGAYGMTWITIAAVASPGLGLKGRGARLALALSALTLAGLYGFGDLRLARAAGAAVSGAPLIRVVQPQTPEQPHYTATDVARILRLNLDLSDSPAARTPDVVVWSEAGVPDALDDYLAPGTWTRAAIAASLKPGQTLLTGGYRQAPAPPGVFAPDGVAYFNSLVALRRMAGDLTFAAIYDKHRLVPFGEYLPLDRYLAPLGVNAIVHVGTGFTAGPPPRPIAPPGVPPVQPLICYESLFPDFVREGAIAAGIRPAWIVNLSDDAWFGVTSGPWQHLNLASYRAIEEGLPLVRATPTGISAVIDAYGRLLPGKWLGPGRRGVIDAPLPPALAPTPFARWGEAPFCAMLLISFLFCAPKWIATLRRNGRNAQPVRNQR
jgi:apolipoprotein N-acyltransferase